MRLHGEIGENRRRLSNLMSMKVLLYGGSSTHCTQGSLPGACHLCLSFRPIQAAGLGFYLPHFCQQKRNSCWLPPSPCPLQCPTLLLHPSLREHWTLVCREKEVLDMFFVGETKSWEGQTAEDGDGIRESLRKVPTGSQDWPCPSTGLSAKHALPYSSIKIAARGGVKPAAGISGAQHGSVYRGQ